MRALVTARSKAGGEEAVSVATARETLGDVLLEDGQPRAAEEEFRKALGRLERVPEHPSWDRISLASAHLGLGRALIAEGDLHAARPHIERALEIQKQLRPKGHPATGEPLAALADLEQRQGRMAEARRHLSEAGRLLRRYPAGHPARLHADRVRLALEGAPASKA
jgi:tetratricopeptide (TPR) repeat protein